MSAEGIEIRRAGSPAEVAGALAVREEVFCREQGVPLSEEHDGRDSEAVHLIGMAPDGRVVATLRLLFSAGTAKVGRVAVEREWRRRGLALGMLELALQIARESGCRQARLAAQVQAGELYRRAGFEVESEPFLDAGIEHVWMGRELFPRAPGAPL